VRVGDQLTVEDLINRIIVVSGNDACVVVAEALGGSEAGLRRSDEPAGQGNRPGRLAFRQSGRIARTCGQTMTAFDLAKLAAPDHRLSAYYHFFSVRSYTTVDQGKSITQPNRNMVLDKFPGADGLKPATPISPVTASRPQRCRAAIA